MFRFLAKNRAYFTLIGFALLIFAGLSKGIIYYLGIENAVLDVALYSIAFLGFISFGLGFAGLRYWVYRIRAKGNQEDPLW